MTALNHRPGPDELDAVGELDTYELHVYALSPLAPTPRRLLADAGGCGLPVDLDAHSNGAADPDSADWSSLVLRSATAPGRGVIVSVSDVLPGQLSRFREDRAAGEEIPGRIFDARRLYLLELPLAGLGEDDEAQPAVLVLVAWALAALTDGLVFDPQEEFFADAESFWALVMDDGEPDAATSDPSIRVTGQPSRRTP